MPYGARQSACYNAGMRVLIAPDSFKGTLTAVQAAAAIAAGLARQAEDVQIERCPIADGGEGTTRTLVDALGGALLPFTVMGPLGDPTEAEIGLFDDAEGRHCAALDLASAAGLTLVPRARRDPTRTTTFGVGELILATLDRGVQRILVGLGGSATCDGGIGLAQALGVRFAGTTARPLTGRDLGEIRRVDTSTRDPRLEQVRLDALCDVRNPLAGPSGAAHVFAPQKGASPEQVAQLDEGLRNLADLTGLAPDTAGMGAAGGAAFGIVALCGGHLCSGIDTVLDAVGFAERVSRADLVITGEGCLDAQTGQGKALSGVLRAARAAGVPAVALVGTTLQPDRVAELGFAAVHTLVDLAGTAERARRDAAVLLEALAARVVVGRHIKR